MLSQIRAALRERALATEMGYRLHLKRSLQVTKPLAVPDARWYNAVLQDRQEWMAAIALAQALGLPPHRNGPKTWDSLAALDCILRHTAPSARILDAGAELYSVILPWLFLYGYRNLVGINLTFRRAVRREPIVYQYGDITHTDFEDNQFDAITCLSVIEHGVDIHSYFAEMSRILKPRGRLITSTDFYCLPVDTNGKMFFGVPIHIFSREEMIDILEVASSHRLELIGELALECGDRPILWAEYGLEYTFVIFTLQKRDD